jgi:cupin fold WbuC family metalloprotein
MIRKINNEVFVLGDPISFLESKKFKFLINKAKESKNNRARYCAHSNPRKKLHEMFIVMTKQCKIIPHKHRYKEESLHVIYGEADLLVYDNKGKIIKKINLGTFSSGKVFYYRINNENFHSLLIKSNYFIIHESTSGPFVRKNTIYSSWDKK